MRVQSIIRELRGEKIDIVEFTEEAAEMVARRPESGQYQSRYPCRPGGKASGGDRGRLTALAGYRQKRTKRPPSGQVDGLAH